VLWTLTLPLAVGALVTAIPPLLSALTWISHLPFVVSSLTWLSQWPLITNLMVLVNSVIGTVSAGLIVAFGPAITTMATVMSIQIPAAVMAVGTVLGMLAIPVAAIVSRVADELSNLWVSWVEQKPFASFGRWISSLAVDNKKTKSPETFLMQKTVFVYQALAGSELIVSQRALHITDEKNRVLKAVEVTDDKAEALYLRAKENNEYNLSYEGARFPTQTEFAATENSPVVVI
jgi:hypothetical protein